jgi:alpha-N-acetylglucosamine transferase
VIQILCVAPDRRIIESETPVNTSAIRGKYLREHINDKAGCCGAKELIKLNAYRLTQFDWVVHVDVDVIILKVSEFNSILKYLYSNKM